MGGRVAKYANIVSLLGAFLATAVVLGLLGAGLMMPVAGAAGVTARQGVHVFDDLPSEFTQTPLSQQSRILASDGTVIATPFDENRIIVPLAQIALVMRQAQIAVEDSRFYEHGGVDLYGVGRAFIANLGGGYTQGASTLTQQYVKITLQENALRNNDRAGAMAATTKSYTRKVQELKYAVTLEKNLTKNQILEGYLNLVYYGDQAYGVEAAARHYFGVSAAKLSLVQAATLAGLVQRPSTTDPIRHPGAALARRNIVLDRMHLLGLITNKAWTAAKKTKLVTHPQPAQSSCALSPYPYFCGYVSEWLLDQPALGKTRADRLDKINRGGLTIQTTLNPKMALAAQQELTAKVPIGNPADIGAAAAVVEPGTGHVLAIAQNTTFSLKSGILGKTSVNWAVGQRYGGSGGFAFGSSAKMFAVAEALRSGMPISSTIVARPADATHPAYFYPKDYTEKACGIVSPWAVHNDEGSHNGPISLTDAAAHSVNTAFAGLVAKLGPCKVRDLMTKMGLHQGNGNQITPGPSATTLGSDSVSPLTLASAYATVASGGTYCPPTPVVSIKTSDNKALALPKNQCKKVLDTDVANGVTKILKAVITNGTGYGNSLAGGRPAAGKTGTAGNQDGFTNETWFVGYTPQLTTAVWVGTPDDKNNTARLRNLKLGKRFYGGEVFGSTIAAPIWKRIMDRASAGMPLRDFADPSGKVQSGDFVAIPRVYGLSLSNAKGLLTSAGFKPVVGYAVNSDLPAGLAVGTQPAYRALRGTAVVIYTSNGVPKPTPSPTQKQTTPPPNPTKTKAGRPRHKP
ncbi:MAG: PASTA domain-containing protein [Phycicoccus sp.]|nr:PASTA domain-containing protein [Phycicoccus sp.]NMM32508.1 PASTA domain-containing protein [Phycicoccus sp.]